MPHSPASVSTRIILTVFIVVCFFADPLLEISTVRSLFLARAVAEDHSFVVDRFAHASKGDLAFFGGHYYCGSMPGFGLISAPVAAIARGLSAATGMRPNLAAQLLGILLINAPIAAFSALLVMKILEKQGIDFFRRGTIALAIVLGTHFFFFAVKFFEYPILICLQLLLVQLLASEKFEAKECLYTGGILGISYVINDLACLLNFLLVLSKFGIGPVLTRLKQAGAIVLGAAPSVLARMFYMKDCFGGYLGNPYDHSAATGTLFDVYQRYPTLLDLISAGLAQAPFVVFDLIIGKRGIFLFAPFYLLLFVLFMRRKQIAWTRPMVAGLVVAAANFAFHFTLLDEIWLSGASWGPRYLLLSLAALVPCFAEASRHVGRSALAALAALSIAVSSIGVQYGYSDNLIYSMGLFFLGGPTTPWFRWNWLHYNLHASPERAALVMEETPRLGAYYAYTHLSPFWAFLIVGLALILLWYPVIRRSIPSGKS